MKVKLGCHEYTVLMKPPEDMEGLWGKIYYGKQKIVLNQELSNSRLFQVLLHEVLHDINMRSGYQIGESGNELENRIECITNGLADFLIENNIVSINPIENILIESEK